MKILMNIMILKNYLDSKVGEIMKDTKFDIEPILYGYYIQYQKMLQLTSETFAQDPNYKNCNTVNIYIDLYDMLMPLYRTDIYANKQLIVVSSIINLAAHMRDYYYTRHGVNSKIYLIYADDTSFNHKQFCTNFGNDKFKETLNYPKINEVIESQLKLVKILCGYIYGVYYIRRSVDFSIVAFDEICKNSMSTPAIVLTKSKYAYQIPAMCNNCVLLRPKKYSGQDTSIAITNTNVLSAYCDKVNSDKSINKIIELSSQLLSLIMVLTGVNCRGITKLLNSNTAINKLHSAVKNNKILNGYNTDTDYVYNNLDISSTIDPMSFKYRFNAIDLVFQHRLYINSAESKDITHLVDLYDKDAVHHINNTYFQDNPLNIDAL